MTLIRRNAQCRCVWHGCSGTGIEQCAGCGGDQCICRCGGERECLGCELCEVAREDEERP